MTKLAYTTIFAATLGLAAFGLADAQSQRGPGGRGGHMGPDGRGGPRLAIGRLADLSDAQRQQIKAILDADRASRQGAPAERTLHRQLRAELLADVPDDQKLESLKQQIAQATADRLSREIAVQKQIAQVLTPEQRAKARQSLVAGR